MTSGHLGRRGVNASVLDIPIRKSTRLEALQDATIGYRRRSHVPPRKCARIGNGLILGRGLSRGPGNPEAHLVIRAQATEPASSAIQAIHVIQYAATSGNGGW